MLHVCVFKNLLRRSVQISLLTACASHFEAEIGSCSFQAIQIVMRENIWWSLFYIWNWCWFPLIQMWTQKLRLNMKIPTQTVPDPTLRTPWSKPPIVAASHQLPHITLQQSPRSVCNACAYSIKVEPQWIQGFCTDQRRSTNWWSFENVLKHMQSHTERRI